MLTQNVKQHSYSWTSLQQPPWERKKLAIVKDGCCRQFLNKGQCADFLSTGTKKGGGCREVTIVERWWLAEVWPYFTFLKAFHYRENESAAHVFIYWRWICLKFLFDMAVPWELSNSQWDSEFSFLMLRTQLEILTQQITTAIITCPQFFLQRLFLCRSRWWQSCLEQTVDCQSRYLDIQS